MFDVGVMFVFGGVGLVMRRAGFPVVCLVIGFILGDMFETSLRQSLLLYKSDITAIFESPIAMVFISLTAILLIRSAWNELGNANR